MIKRLLFIFLMVTTIPIVDAHTFDTSSQAVAATSPVTLSYTAGSNSTVLVVGLAINSLTARAGGAPTYNGIPLTQANVTQTAASEVAAELWYLLNPPTGSAFTISVPNTGTFSIRVIASTYNASAGYSSALDIAGGWTGSTANPSNSLTTTVNGDAIVDIMGNSKNTAETANNQVLLFANDEGNWNTAAQYALQATAGAITFTHTIAIPNDWGHIMAAFKEVDTSPPNVTSNTNNVFVSNRSLVTLNASITDYLGGSGVKNATVNVSGINTTIN
ncbi:MAG: hypothetical protein WC568_01725, partial [Candidatus Methanoperedens sp.]